MTDTKRHHNDPTPRQLDLLRKLTSEREVTYAVPSTFAEANKQIKRLLRMPKPSAAERRRELREIQGELAQGRGEVARAHPEELGGYGSSAHWT